MSNTIPVQILLRCDSCLHDETVLRWLPDDHWKELSEIEEVKCKLCSGIMKTISYKIVEVKLIKRMNEVILEVGDFRERILSLSPNERIIELHVGGLLRIPFFGELLLSGPYHETLKKFTFSSNGVIIEE